MNGARPPIVVMRIETFCQGSAAAGLEKVESDFYLYLPDGPL